MMSDVIETKSKEWFEMLLQGRSEKEVKSLYKELEEIFNSNLSDYILIFEIHKIRYHLYLRDHKAAENQIRKMHKVTDSFGPIELYYWHKFRANFYSEASDNTSAVRNYEKAEEISRRLDISEEEVADLHYSLSVTYSQLRQTLESIEYANRALEIFMKKYQFIRCAQCHIVLGISYRRIKMYEKAIENYDIAKHLAGLGGNQHLIQLTNQNLGFLYATKGKYPEAIKFYLEIVQDSEIGIEDRISALTELIKVYYRTGDIGNARDKIEQALELLEKHPKNRRYDYFNYVIYTYYYAIHEENSKFITLVKNKLIPFLTKHQDYASLATFSIMLAEHYENHFKYKEAAKYYKLANHSYNELSTI
jgi:tetratricopeptide (TPR) repeat protein